MATWTEINRKIDWFAGDEEPEDPDIKRLFPEGLRIESWNWSQDVFAHHTPRQREMIAEIDTGNRSIILPSDFFAIEGLYDSSEEQWWWPMRRRPGDLRSPDDSVLEFWLWSDKLYLESDVTYTGDNLTLLYWAYWPQVEYTESATGQITVTQQHVYVPRWAELALMHLTAASCMVPLEIESSDISQWRIRFESGDPLDNPRMQSSKWHLSQYERLLEKFPPARVTEIG